MTLVSTMLACATCFGAADSPQTDGMNMAIITLLGVTGLVLGGIVCAIVHFARRAKRYQVAEQILDQLTKNLPQIE